MVNGNCAVVGCQNSRYRIKVWEQKDCEDHPGQLKKYCQCLPQFRLFKFPSVQRNSDSRKEWVRLMNRTTKKNTNWKPGQSDMVCSKHFVDGLPTSNNPYPTLQLGYEKPTKKPRRQLVRKEDEAEPAEAEAREIEEQPMQIESDPAYISSADPCESCLDNSKIISSLTSKTTKLDIENRKLNADISMLSDKVKNLEINKRSRKPFTSSAIKSDAKMRFYTGIQTILGFIALYSILKPHVPLLLYWRGSKRVLTSQEGRKRRNTKSHKLCGKDQFLLVLMRLRLGLLNQDLADRFHISEATTSSIFATWIRFLGEYLGNGLIKWLPKETVLSNLPAMFKGSYRKTICIIDCSEVFIERPKSLDVQAATWSDYKKHNTYKFLIAISPTGYIMFLSDCYGGRATDQFICRDSGFYNFLEFGDEVMADRGFQIKEDLLHRYCSLSIPPGARVKAQMTAGECKKTKEVANLRIHVERAINRLKCFRILKNVFPVTMLPLADDIIRTCACICNIQPPLLG